MAKKEEEKAAREKARQVAEATKKAQVAASRAIKEAEKAANERARQEAEAAKKVQVAAAMARKEEEKAAREKIRQEDEAAKKAQVAAARARKEEEEAAREKARQEAEAARKAQLAAAMAIKEKEEVIVMERRNSFQVNSRVERKPRKPVATMTPLFSGRSLLVLVIGLIVGMALALGYWVVSPSFSSTDDTAGGPAGGREAVIAGNSANGTEIVVAGGIVDSQAKATGLKGIIESVKSIQGTHNGPWESNVNIQVVSPGSTVMSLDKLNEIGTYYSTKANNVRFLQFLSQELDRQVPEYSYTPDELGQMVLIQFDAYQEAPTVKVNVTAPTFEETAFLCSYVPEVFQRYLVVEEISQRQQEYENTVKEIETVKQAILEAQEELRTLRSQGTDSDNASIDPTRVALNARIVSLETELSYQAGQISEAIAAGTVIEDNDIRQQEYQRTVQEARNVRVSLTEAEQKLGAIAEQMADSTLNNDVTYITLTAKVKALETELAAQMEELAGYIATANTGNSYKNTLKAISRINSTLIYTRKELATLENTSSDSDLVLDSDYLIARAEVDNLNMELTALIERLTMLARESVGVGEVISSSDPQAAFDRVSVALAEARKELATLDNTSVTDSVAADLDYQLAQAKIQSLNKELTALNTKLISSLVSSNSGVEIADYFAVQKPDAPTPVVPMRFRNVILLGAVVGIGGAWVGLNFKWLAKGTPAVEEETDES